MKVILRGLLGALLLLVLSSCAAPSVAPVINSASLVLTNQQHQLTITAYQSDTLGVVIHERSKTPFPSFALAEQAQLASLSVLEQTPDSITVMNGNIRARINLSDWRIDYYSQKQPLTTQLSYQLDERLRQFNFSLSAEEKLAGGGQRVLGMDRRGHRLPLYNRAHYGYGNHSEQMYYSVPAVMSDRRYLLAFDNTAKGYLDIGHSQTKQLEFSAVGGRAGYFITSAPSYPKLISAFTQVVGRQPLPPRWALGNFASRFGYRSQAQVMETVALYNQHQIPLDSIILDLYWFGADIKGHMGNLAWDKQNFPQPQAMIEQLQQQNIKTILITEPFILSSSQRWQEASEAGICTRDASGAVERFNFYFGNTCLIDIFNQASIDWFSAIYDDLTAQGIAGQWGDLGEPEVHPDATQHWLSEFNRRARGDEIHNAFGHQWAKVVYQQQRRFAANKRPLIMMRSGFLGTQRYGIIPWTGDVARNWEGLSAQVELSLQMSLMGLAYTHSDLGGFAGAKTFDSELYLRWLQYGVFQPVFRPHAQDHIAPEPVYHDAAVIARARDAINLRYQMTPYNYSLAIENSLTGMPLMRPVFFAEENRFNDRNSYFWGDAFWVVPLTAPKLTDVELNFPPGVWFDFYNDKRFQAGAPVNYPTRAEGIPVFVKAGSFVPMVSTFSRMTDYSTANMDIHYFADSTVTESTYLWFNDDGESANSLADKNYQALQFSFLAAAEKWQIKLTDNSPRAYPSDLKQLNFILHGVTQRPSAVAYPAGALAFQYDATNQQLKFTLPISIDSSLITIHFRSSTAVTPTSEAP